jgi:hypothetical protein
MVVFVEGEGPVAQGGAAELGGEREKAGVGGSGRVEEEGTRDAARGTPEEQAALGHQHVGRMAREQRGDGRAEALEEELLGPRLDSNSLGRDRGGRRGEETGKGVGSGENRVQRTGWEHVQRALRDLRNRRIGTGRVRLAQVRNNNLHRTLKQTEM